MIWSAVLNNKPMTMEVFLQTNSPEKIWICVYDFENQNRKFTERSQIINGNIRVDIMMPQTPVKCAIIIYNERIGKTAIDTTFKVLDFRQSKLKQNLDVIGLQNNDVRNFVRFAQNFCYYLTELPARGEKEINGQISTGDYRSDNKKFFIEFESQQGNQT